MAETQVCRQCGERKPLDAFERSHRRNIGRRANCRSCRHANRRRNRAMKEQDARVNR